MPKPVFISYSKRDADFVNKLESAMKKAGIETWVDSDRFTGGEEWMASLAGGLENSAAVVLVISPDAVKSKWVYKEISYAVRRGIQVIPIVCRDAQIPPRLDYPIGGVQRIDFTGRSFVKGMNALIKAIGSVKQDELSQSGRLENPESDFTIHVEDVVEFLQRIPVRMVLRFCRLNGLTYKEIIWRVIMIANPGPLPTFVFYLIFYSVLAIVFNHLYPYPHEAREDIFAVVAFALVSTIIMQLPARHLRRLMRRAVSEVFSDLPYRPMPKMTNKLLDRWNENVKPIIWQLLYVPASEWMNYVEKRVRDEGLAARITLSVTILVSITS